MEFHNILIPVAGIETDQGTVELAYRLLPKKNKGKIYAVYVIPIERTLPLDAEIESEIRKADEILNHTEKIAEEQGHKIETDLLQARDIGPAIINEAIEIAKKYSTERSGDFVNGILDRLRRVSTKRAAAEGGE